MKIKGHDWLIQLEAGCNCLRQKIGDGRKKRDLDGRTTQSSCERGLFFEISSFEANHREVLLVAL